MIRTALRATQLEAVERAISFDGFLILSEQRVGKTLTALAIVDRRKPSHLVIVCPLAAIPEWDAQIRQHLFADWKCHLTVINYEELSRNKKKRRAYFKWAKSIGKQAMLIVDEIHWIKRRGSGFSKSVRTFARRFKYRLGLTGTPIAQGIWDAWALMDFADKTVFGKYEEFAERYVELGGFRGEKPIGSRNLDEFNERFHSRSYRITLREAKRETGKTLAIRRRKVYFDLTPETEALYRILEKQLRLEVNARKIKIKSMMTAVIKLQQLTGGSVIETPEFGSARYVHHLSNEKLLALKSVLPELIGSKFIVVCRFIHEIERLEQYLTRKGLTVKVVRGGHRFDRKFEQDVILMQVRSGVAVDMSAADAIVFYSTDYSYLNYEQARFRILSYDKLHARYYFLLGRCTIDELIYETISRKKKLADIVCDHYRRSNGKVRAIVRPSQRRLVARAVDDAIRDFIK